ncbi:MAG: hypothetical protein C4558_10145 [Dehalococcoidia bacterium]|nr:MAG: hypothetical protein C4558_10145 [Dehalococcoidia bacterium]
MTISEPLPSSDDFRRLATAHAHRIEAFFGKRGLGPLRRQYPEHPAIAEVDVLRRFADNSGIPLYEEIAFLSQIHSMTLEAMHWPPGGGSADPLSFAPTPAIRKYLASRLREPGSYGDTMAELFTWGRLASNGLGVQAMVADQGLPDLRLTKDGWSVVGDVKRIHVGSNTDAAHRAVQKANKQIREVPGPHQAGIAWIYVERPLDRIALDDRIPSDVVPYVEVVAGILNGSTCRSVTVALIIWDDVKAMDKGDGSATYIFSRRCHVINHSQPRVPLPASVDQFQPTVWSAIRSAHPSPLDPTARGVPVPREIRARQDITTVAFRQLSELGDGIHAGQALEVLADPDDFEVIGRTVLIATRHVPIASHTLIVFASLKPDGRREVSVAFRLPDSLRHSADRASPVMLLTDLLGHFGLPVRMNGSDELFREHVRVPIRNNEPILTIPDNGGSGFAHAVVRHGDGFDDAFAVFAIDSGKYQQALRDLAGATS